MEPLGTLNTFTSLQIRLLCIQQSPSLFRAWDSPFSNGLPGCKKGQGWGKSFLETFSAPMTQIIKHKASFLEGRRRCPIECPYLFFAYPWVCKVPTMATATNEHAAWFVWSHIGFFHPSWFGLDYWRLQRSFPVTELLGSEDQIEVFITFTWYLGWID